jgi:prevent-host-death family protein
MQTISLLDFRQDAEGILARVQKGQRIILTRRGKPVARLEPIADDAPGTEDPFYRLGELSAAGGESLSNAQIDDIVYGQ